MPPCPVQIGAAPPPYGWEWPLSEEQVLERLLSLNQARAAGTAATDAGARQAKRVKRDPKSARLL